MTSNNGSRKRRRVTLDDAEAPSGRGRVDGRDTDQDYGLSSGRGDEGLGYVARDDDVSTRRVGEVTGDGVRAHRPDHTGAVEPPRQQPTTNSQGGQEGPDNFVPPHIGGAGHARGGQSVNSVEVGGSANQFPRDDVFWASVRQVRRRIMQMVAEMPRGERVNLGLDGVRPEDPPIWVHAGGHDANRDALPGLWTALAVVELFTGTMQNGTALDAFIINSLQLERAEGSSSTREVVCVHVPVRSLIGEPNVDAIRDAAESAYRATSSSASTEQSREAMHNEMLETEEEEGSEGRGSHRAN